MQFCFNKTYRTNTVFLSQAKCVLTDKFSGFILPTANYRNLNLVLVDDFSNFYHEKHVRTIFLQFILIILGWIYLRLDASSASIHSFKYEAAIFLTT